MHVIPHSINYIDLLSYKGKEVRSLYSSSQIEIRNSVSPSKVVKVNLKYKEYRNEDD